MTTGRQRNARNKSRQRLPAPPPPDSTDVVIADERAIRTAQALGADRLTFDGYTLRWHGSSPASYTAFSGPANESLRESVKDDGPTPQGLFAVDPANVEELEPTDDWGRHRVRLEPYGTTVDRMKTCFGLIRTGMYIH